MLIADDNPVHFVQRVFGVSIKLSQDITIMLTVIIFLVDIFCACSIDNCRWNKNWASLHSSSRIFSILLIIKKVCCTVGYLKEIVGFPCLNMALVSQTVFNFLWPRYIQRSTNIWRVSELQFSFTGQYIHKARS